MKLSVMQALAELDGIDRSMAAYERTDPAAFQAFGGREAMLATSQATCVGPVPRLSNEQWAPFAGEHAERQRGMASARDPRARAGSLEGQEPGVDVYPSRHAGPMFRRA